MPAVMARLHAAAPSTREASTTGSPIFCAVSKASSQVEHLVRTLRKATSQPRRNTGSTPAPVQILPVPGVRQACRANNSRAFPVAVNSRLPPPMLPAIPSGVTTIRQPDSRGAEPMSWFKVTSTQACLPTTASNSLTQFISQLLILDAHQHPLRRRRCVQRGQGLPWSQAGDGLIDGAVH